MASASRWRSRLAALEAKHRSKAVYVNMRYGVNDMYIVMMNGDVVHEDGKNFWIDDFVHNDKSVRPSCKTCELNYPNIPGDFIVGDAWGFKDQAAGMKAIKSNIVFCMNERASSVMDEISPRISKKQIDVEYSLAVCRKHNPRLFSHR